MVFDDYCKCSPSLVCYVHFSSTDYTLWLYRLNELNDDNLKTNIHFSGTESVRAGLTIRGPHTNVRRGPFSRTQSQDILICGGVCVIQPTGCQKSNKLMLNLCALFPKKVVDLFLVVVTFKRTLNVQTSKQRGKKCGSWSAEGPLATGAPPPPMVQPAQWIIGPWRLYWLNELNDDIVKMDIFTSPVLRYHSLLCWLNKLKWWFLKMTLCLQGTLLFYWTRTA